MSSKNDEVFRLASLLCNLMMSVEEVEQGLLSLEVHPRVIEATERMGRQRYHEEASRKKGGKRA